jgi:hypothetical protein
MTWYRIIVKHSALRKRVPEPTTKTPIPRLAHGQRTGALGLSGSPCSAGVNMAGERGETKYIKILFETNGRTGGKTNHNAYR